MDEPASALDPISTTQIEDLIHELKREYTIVIVTHNMQQAARVADMTAFFSVPGRRGDGYAHGCAGRVRQHREDLHHARRQAHRGLRDGTVRLDRVSFRKSSTSSRLSLRGEGELVLRSLRGAVEAVCSQDAGLADEVIAFDDDIDSQYFEVEQGIELLLARQTPVASDLRLVLALLKDNLHLERMGDLCVTIAKLTKLSQGLAAGRAAARGVQGDGRARRADDPGRAPLARAARPRRRRVAARARRADRPRQPPRRQPPARARARPRERASGACG